MAPTLYGGDIVITRKIKPGALRPGLICVINHSDLGSIIKRLGEQTQSGHYRLIGDNISSTPQAVMGTVEPERITRRAVLAVTQSRLKTL